MSDLTERLRKGCFAYMSESGPVHAGPTSLEREAADEIERLTRELKQARNTVANSAHALESAVEWLSCVEGHLQDGHAFKRDYAIISGVTRALKEKP